jgi:rRNA maturation endonuclease Nob1
MAIILLSIILLALAIAGIAIKILVKKDGKFSGTCSSNNPLFQKDSGACGICGAKPEEKCKA